MPENAKENPPDTLPTRQERYPKKSIKKVAFSASCMHGMLQVIDIIDAEKA